MSSFSHCLRSRWFLIRMPTMPSFTTCNVATAPMETPTRVNICARRERPGATSGRTSMTIRGFAESRKKCECHWRIYHLKSLLVTGDETMKLLLSFTRFRPTFRILNGTCASYGELPWVAQIQLRAPGGTDMEHQQHCGGTIISDDLVLTAAHCFA